MTCANQTIHAPTTVFGDIRRAIVIALVAALGAAPALGADEAAKAKDTAANPNPFAAAIQYAQKRCIKLYGAGIGREHGYATGLIVSPDGMILTAQGIYMAGAHLRIVLPDGVEHDAKVLGRSDALQAALLKVDAATPDYFELAAEPVVDKGDWVLAVSNAFKVADGAEPLSVNLGVVSLRARLDTKHRTQDVDYDGEVLLIDAITSNPGAPGGALVTAEGKLAGMIGKIIESQSTNTRLNYAVPADLLRQFVDAVRRGEPPPTPPPAVASSAKPYVGIRLFKLSGPRAPAYIDAVAAGSPAAKAGLRQDDLVLSLDDQRVPSVRDFEKLAAALKPGAPVQLIYKRKNQILTATLTPVAQEPSR